MKKWIRASLMVTIICLLVGISALAAPGNEIVGTVDTLIRENTGYGSAIEETDLGNVTADALSFASGADVSIVNGGELLCNLQAGQRTRSDIEAIFKENRTLAVADVTAAQLWDMLEYGVSHAVLKEDQKIDTDLSAFQGFPQVSGLWFKYDLSAPAGERVKCVELADGRALLQNDEETHITLCATEYMLSGGYGYESVKYESLGMGLVDALEEYMGSTTLTQPSGSARIRTIGSNDEPLISRTTVFIVAFAACIIMICAHEIKDRLRGENEL